MLKFLSLFLLLSLFNFVSSNGGGGGLGASSESKIFRIFENISKFLFSVLMLLSVGLFIYLGILYISGREKIKDITTSKAILYLILGIVLLITSFFIPNLIKNFIESSIK